MDNFKKQDNYVVLNSTQNAYDNDMVNLKASETSASRYASSKILVYALGTKNGFFPLKKMGGQGPCWTSLKTHMHTEISQQQ
jgi:hypothetical protein